MNEENKNTNDLKGSPHPRIDLGLLDNPFPEKDIDWRISRAGKTNDRIWAFVLAYIDARAVMDRLDEIVGKEGWKDRYWKDGQSNMCGISIKVNGEWIEKIDGADDTDIEAVKGGISGAFKRAAVKWGIGRYLYNLTENFAQVVDKGTKSAKMGQLPKETGGDRFYWLPPALPSWAKPEPLKDEPKNDNDAVAQKTAQKNESLKARLEIAQAINPDSEFAKSPKGPSLKAADPQAERLAGNAAFMTTIKNMLSEITSMQELKAFWGDYAESIDALTEPFRSECIKAKDEVKKKFV